MRNTLLRVAAHGLSWIAVGALACGCSSVSSLTREGRVGDAWKRLCDGRVDARAASPATAGTPEDRLALRAALRAATTASIEGRAMSRHEISGRLGEALFPREALLLELRVRAARHHGAGLAFRARLSVHEEAPAASPPAPARTWRPVTGRELWALAGQTPPTPSTAEHSEGGQLVDWLTRIVTFGQADFGLRNRTKPGTPGGGTPRQAAALEILAGASEGPCVTADDTPCERTFVLAPGADVAPDQPRDVAGARGDEDTRPIFISLNQRAVTAPGDADALIIELIHVADETTGPRACDWLDEIALPLPPGPSVVERLNALFARGPVALLPRVT